MPESNTSDLSVITSEEETKKHKERDIHSLRKKKAYELEEAFRKFAGQKMLVFIKGHPDPDSIASAWAHRFIGSNLGVEVNIVYFDPVSHAENRALVKTLGVAMIPYSDEMDLSDYTCYALVDTQANDFPALEKMPEEAVLFSVVDHHRNMGKLKAYFTDIRENAGATSSIYAEYLKYGSVSMTMGNTEDVELSTALHHGIRSDTDNFLLAREIDWRAATYLCTYADNDMLRVIASSPITANTMDILQKALASKEIRDNYIFSGVGFVRDSDRDGIAQAADYLVRREGIDTAIIFGIVDDKYIHGSLRTQSTTVDPDSFLKSVLGVDKETGKPYGGGRLDKGGFQIPLGMFSGCNDRELLWELVSRTIKSKFLKSLGG